MPAVFDGEGRGQTQGVNIESAVIKNHVFSIALYDVRERKTCRLTGDWQSIACRSRSSPTVYVPRSNSYQPHRPLGKGRRMSRLVLQTAYKEVTSRFLIEVRFSTESVSWHAMIVLTEDKKPRRFGVGS